jgi:hypothetical protein
MTGQEDHVKTVLTIAAMILATAPAVAANSPPPINIIFSGDNATCAAWLKSAGNHPLRQHYEMWVRGFASGHNYADPAGQVKVGAFPSGDDLYRYFDQYCRDNPQQSFVGGAIQLVEQLAEPLRPAKVAPARKTPAKTAVPAK